MMKRNQYKITHARLIEAFEYDASIGRLRRRNKSRSIAGTAHGNGYRAQLRVGGVAFLGSVRETVEKARADYMAFRTKYCPQVWAHG